MSCPAAWGAAETAVDAVTLIPAVAVTGVVVTDRVTGVVVTVPLFSPFYPIANWTATITTASAPSVTRIAAINSNSISLTLA